MAVVGVVGAPRDVADEARRNFALALSDHLTLLKAYDGWRLAKGCGSRAEREYIRDHFLSRQTLVMVEEMRRQFRGLLRDIGFIEGGGTRSSRGGGRGDDQQQHSSNINGGNIQLIKAVVCAGLYPNVTVAPASLCPTSTSSSATGGAKKSAGGGAKGGGKGAAAEKTAGEVSMQGRKGPMFLHPMTVNFDKKELDSRYGVYHEVVKTSKSVSTLLKSGARMAGAQQDYSTEMLAAEINGVRQGAHGADGWGGDGAGRGGARGYEQQPDGRQDRHGQKLRNDSVVSES
eukprot:g15772.t1